MLGAATNEGSVFFSLDWSQAMLRAYVGDATQRCSEFNDRPGRGQHENPKCSEQQAGIHSGNQHDQQRKRSEFNDSVPIHYKLPWDQPPKT
jgi:hypothetical protein